MAMGMKRNALAVLARIEAEGLVEGLSLVEVGYGEAEMIERMHAQRRGGGWLR